MPATEHISRWASSSFDISSENSATGCRSCTATCSAMFSARLVLPIDGRAARMTRFDRCSPAVMRSRSRNPVPMPVTPSGALAGGQLGDAHERVGEQLADRGEVLAVSVPREVVHDLLGLVDEILDLAGAVVAELRDLPAGPDQAAQRRVGAHDLGVAPRRSRPPAATRRARRPASCRRPPRACPASAAGRETVSWSIFCAPCASSRIARKISACVVR